MARTQYRHRHQRRRHFSFSRLLVFLMLIFIIVWPFYEGYHINVDEHTATYGDLPANLKNLKIVFVSDIHKSSRFPQSRVEELVNQINGMSADLVLLGGDYADDSDGAIEFFQHLPKLKARLGVFGVVGNHDRTEPESNFNTLVKEMDNAGVIPLTNYVYRLTVGATSLCVAGVDDYNNGYPDVAGVASQVSRDDFVIFVGHSPDLMTAALKASGKDGDNHWFDLALFGHTHGGQVTLLGHPLFSELTPEIGSRYLSGWSTENRANILVSNGVGTSVFPVRLFAPAQVHLITLKKGS